MLRTMNITPRHPQPRRTAAALLAALLFGSLAACTSSSSPAINTEPTLSTSTALTSAPALMTTSTPSGALPNSHPAITSTSPTTTALTTTTSKAPATLTTPPTSGSASISDKRFGWTVDRTAAQTTAAKAAVKAAAPIYLGYMTTYDDSLRAPNAKDWEVVMKNYAAERALSDWRAAWQGQVKYGLVQKGTTSAVGRVRAAGLTSDGVEAVTVRACMDFSHVNVVDQAGNTIPMQDGLPVKDFGWLMTIEQSSGKMLVTNIASRTQSGKTFPC